MQTGVVYGGRSRLLREKEFRANLQTRLFELRTTIEARYTAELASAGWFRRLRLQWRIAAEYRRERRKLVPSPASLFSRDIKQS